MIIQKSKQTIGFEYIYIVNHHELIKIEKIHIYFNIPLIHVKMTIFGDIPILKNFGARCSARACMIFQKSKKAFDIE